jgi:uncharacterized linocin/CFP29 family protein
MTTAQKIAKEKFKKAIAYRQKSGVSLKEAFAHVYGKKIVKKKTAKKVAKKRISGPKDSALVKKELARKGLKMPHGYTTTKRKRKISGVKKKKISEQGILNKIHIVKRNVDKLDEAQHKHMMGKISKHSLEAVKSALNRLNEYKTNLERTNNALKMSKEYGFHANYISQLKDNKKRYTDLIKETKTHITQVKKHI